MFERQDLVQIQASWLDSAESLFKKFKLMHESDDESHVSTHIQSSDGLTTVRYSHLSICQSDPL